MQVMGVNGDMLHLEPLPCQFITSKEILEAVVDNKQNDEAYPVDALLDCDKDHGKKLCEMKEDYVHTPSGRI